MVNYCGNYVGKKYDSGRGAKAKSISERVCGAYGTSDAFCQDKKTRRYSRIKKNRYGVRRPVKRKFEQSHDGKFCRPRNDKRDRDSDGRIIRYYD